ncbi:helix-turn-helix domain-containing protein [Labilibacter marinus]|uniref:helix-turn-helix domain-containing protein n=1 Tax=Labilibacter marinus TaxID=1477105 RepID=UPI00082B3AE9|nr:AraC family transcriptional regulator [Labilibacter marinus]
MTNKDYIHLKYKEGTPQNLLKGIQKALGGEITDNSYQLKQGRTDIRIEVHHLIPELEVMITEATHSKNVLQDKEADDDPDYIHMFLIQEGKFEQSFNQKQGMMEAGTSRGIFIYNGLFPINAYFPANVVIKTIAFKVKKATIANVMPEALDILNSLFPDDSPLAYHTAIPVKMQAIMNDVFYYQNVEFGKKTMVAARGLELFTDLLSSVKKLVDEDELHGLHVDDYQRLIKIKDQILSSFDQRINIEELATEFSISLSKLKRDFKTLYDTSVYQFYTHAKMDEAYRRLQSGNYSVTEVGYDLGYQSLPKFSQMFKKVKGINPKEVVTL